MTDKDKQRFVTVLVQLASAFGAPAPQMLLEGYWMGLKSMDLRAFEQAAARAVATLKFFPKPVELRELAGEVAMSDRPVIAWERVRSAIRELGEYKSVSFDDPTTNAAVRNIGGWKRLCNLSAEELEKWTRKEFERAYNALADMPLSPEAVAYLPGLHEAANHGIPESQRLPSKVHDVRVGLPPLPRDQERARLTNGHAESRGALSEMVKNLAEKTQGEEDERSR